MAVRGHDPCAQNDAGSTFAAEVDRAHLSASRIVFRHDAVTVGNPHSVSEDKVSRNGSKISSDLGGRKVQSFRVNDCEAPFSVVARVVCECMPVDRNAIAGEIGSTFHHMQCLSVEDDQSIGAIGDKISPCCPKYLSPILRRPLSFGHTFSRVVYHNSRNLNLGDEPDAAVTSKC